MAKQPAGPSATSPPMPCAGHASTAFLDIDEVLCIGQPEACLELSRRMSAGDVPSSQELEVVFSPVARNALAVIHRRIGGAVRYVISSSWREHFSREAMALLLHRGGMPFIAENLHAGEAWRCVPKRIYRERQAEILDWLATHHRGEPFVILDDHYSAGQLAFIEHFPDSPLQDRVILCQPGSGLTMDKVDDIVAALRSRPDGDRVE